MESCVVVVGSRLATFGLVAEKAANAVCEKPGIDRACHGSSQYLARLGRDRIVGEAINSKGEVV